MKTTIFTILLSTAFLFSNNAIADGTNGSTKSPARVSTTVYPNPVFNIVTVSWSEPLEQPIVETFNVNGQKVTPPQSSQGDGSNKTEIDMSNQPAGIYFLKIFSAGELIGVQKILKQ